MATSILGYYLTWFYYDCLTHSEQALRFLIYIVGIEAVVFGTDWPADMAVDLPVSWALALESLAQKEEATILWENAEDILGIQPGSSSP